MIPITRLLMCSSCGRSVRRRDAYVHEGQLYCDVCARADGPMVRHPARHRFFGSTYTTRELGLMLAGSILFTVAAWAAAVAVIILMGRR